MSYDQAIREYGIDKPDMRLPAMTDVRAAFAPENLATLNIDPELPIVAIVTPKVGELSRKERDDIKPLFGDRKDAKVFEDIKRLEKSFPDAVAKIRELTQAHADDLIVIVGAPARPSNGNGIAGQAPANWRSRSRELSRRIAHQARFDRFGPALHSRAGALRSRRTASPRPRPEVRRQARRVRQERLPFPLGHRLPHVRVGRDRPALERRPPSLHLAARRRHGQARERSRRGARAGLRRGAQRHRTGLGLHPYSPRKTSRA